MLFRKSVALLLPTVLYYFLSLYPLMADAFPRRFSHRREKRVSGVGGSVKKESQLRLLSHHALKQFNPESVPVQKCVIMNRLYL